MLHSMSNERNKFIDLLIKLPQEEFFRRVRPDRATLAEAIMMTVGHDMACLQALEMKSEIVLPGPEAFPNHIALINGLIHVENEKVKLLKRMSDSDLDLELNIQSTESPHRRGRVRDMVERLIDISLPHTVALGNAIIALGHREELEKAMGMFKAPKPEEFN